MLSAIAAALLLAAPDASVPARTLADLSREVRDAALQARKTAFELSREGKYDQAAAALEASVAAAEQKLVAHKADPQRPNLVPDQKLAEAYRTRGQLAVKAPKDKNSAWLLLQSIIDNRSMDIERATLADPRAQALLELLRTLDPKANALFGPRKVKVVVESSIAETHKAFYVQELVANLRLLGFAASSEEGDEEFRVVHSEGKPVNVELVKGVVGCEAIAVATWKGKGGKVEMANLDLGRRAAGFSDLPETCVKGPLKPSAELAPVMMLRNYAAR